MSDFMSYKEFMERQPEFRGRLLKLIIDSEAPLGEVAKEVGIVHTTLRRFIKEEKEVDYKTLCKVRNYILKKEKELECPPSPCNKRKP